jgi:cytochrome P450
MAVYNPGDPRLVSDPVGYLNDIRNDNPRHFAPGGYWVVAEHADCLAVLRNRDASSDALHGDPDRQPAGVRDRRQQQMEDLRNGAADTRPFLFRDPPDHTRLRGLVQKAFTPRRVAELGPFITRVTDDILDRVIDAGAVDVVHELAWRVPVAVICEMLAIPAADHESFEIQSGFLARGLDPDFLLSDEDRAGRDAAILHFGLYFHELFAQRRANPGDDLLSALLAARDGDDLLSEGELLSTAILLLVAGHETTTNLISGALRILAEQPDLAAHLRANPALDRTAVDEFLRVVSPVQLTGRTMAADVTVGDVTLEKGTFAFLLLAAANRDPAVFERPDEVILDRAHNPHVGFGFGLHHCLGAPLARLETQIVLRRVLERTSTLAVADTPIVRPNVVLRGLETLPLTLQS